MTQRRVFMAMPGRSLQNLGQPGRVFFGLENYWYNRTALPQTIEVVEEGQPDRGEESEYDSAGRPRLTRRLCKCKMAMMGQPCRCGAKMGQGCTTPSSSTPGTATYTATGATTPGAGVLPGGGGQPGAPQVGPSGIPTIFIIGAAGALAVGGLFASGIL